MSFTVDEILENVSKQGFSPEELKEVVIDTLNPFFQDKVMLNKEAMDSDFLSMFSYILLYHSDKLFSKRLLDLLNCYRKAYSNNPNKITNIILSTANLMGQKENLMWSVKSNTPKNISGDIYEVTYSLMKHIGDVLEISAKHEITELYAFLEISFNNDLDYEVLKNRDFGVVVQNILDKKYFEYILKTFPNNIKLSDWRNIAYHHTYEINNDKIKCFYGKRGNNFEINLNELYNYAGAIIKSCNILDIARRIFLFDNAKFFSDEITNEMVGHERVDMKIGQLRTAFLGQGFKLVDEKINSDYEEIILEDIELSNTSTDEFQDKRLIHCTQFLYNLWLKFPSKMVCIIHTNDSAEKLFKYSIDGQICEKISKELMEFEDMFKFVTIEKL